LSASIPSRVPQRRDFRLSTRNESSTMY
jgi:hypothetical protein